MVLLSWLYMHHSPSKTTYPKKNITSAARRLRPWPSCRGCCDPRRSCLPLSLVFAELQSWWSSFIADELLMNNHDKFDCWATTADQVLLLIIDGQAVYENQLVLLIINQLVIINGLIKYHQIVYWSVRKSKDKSTWLIWLWLWSILSNHGGW